METMSPSSSSMSTQREASTFDELSMQQSLLFRESLKDLRSLRSQLYSAAEYFELAYTNEDQKQLVLSTLKDYALKALLNTVDHLGSVSYKVNKLLDEKADEVSGTELRMSCVEQRLKLCQEHIDHEGRSQQSLLIKAPKYHKHYILPGGVSMPESGIQARAKCEESKLHKDEAHEFQAAIHSTIRDQPRSLRKPSYLTSFQRARSSSPSRKARSSSPTPKPAKRAASPLPTAPFPRSGTFSITDKRAVSVLPVSLFPIPGKISDKRSVSPLPNPFARSGSMSSKSNIQTTSSTKQRFPLKPQKSASICLHAERNNDKEIEAKLSKSRSFLKAMLPTRKLKKDDMLYTYLDEY